jgi:hypothetical protein
MAMANQSRARSTQPNWPTVDDQIAVAKAPHGSALERLIRENQELHILRVEEANDKVRLPPWIRIHWRKLHPDAQYIGPSGGYPLTLQNLHDWMVAHPDLRGYTGHLPSSGSTSRGRRGK